MDRGAWWSIVHGVEESDTTEQLSAHMRVEIQYIHEHILYWACIEMVKMVSFQTLIQLDKL